MVSITIAMQGFVSVDEILKWILIQVKATEQYFPVVQFIMLYIQGGSNLNLSLRKKSSSVTIQIKATE